MTNILELIERLVVEHSLEREQYIRLFCSWRDIGKDYLFALARETAAGVYGRDIFLRGLIEITNYCRNNCFYCGIRKSNRAVTRYRLNNSRVMECCRQGYMLGLRSFVLQGGEDPELTDECICALVAEIKQRYPDAAVSLSLGEKSYESYAAYRQAGADRYLLRHETADAAHYAELHPRAMSFESRLRCLRDLSALGYQVGAGFMVGSPNQTAETLAEDFLYLQKLRPHMVGIGPFIPHKDTPFAEEQAGSVELTLILLALVRLMLPEALLPATTALGTLDGACYEHGILAGANVIMPNLTPPTERALYQIYDGKNSMPADKISDIADRMAAIGYRAVMGRGDHVSINQRQTA